MEQTLNPPEQSSVSQPTIKRGRIKLFISYCAGAGKTYAMLGEANRRKHGSHENVVIGTVETHGRAETEAQIGDLEIIPRKSIEYRGAWFEEMDVERIIRRKPDYVLVDELAHLNVPGSKHPKRCFDVLDLAYAGINVLTAVNAAHIESLNNVVQQISGVKIRETVPDSFMEMVDELVNVDVTTEELINRLENGKIYHSDKAPIAVASFFTEANLSALRELTLRKAAEQVNRSLETLKQKRGISSPWQTQEKVMVCLSQSHPSDRLLRRAWTVSTRLHAPVTAVLVVNGAETEKEIKSLDIDIKLAGDLGINVEKIHGKDNAQALADYAWKNKITQIILGHSHKSRIYEMMYGSIMDDLASKVHGIDLLIVANPE
jgi:two-component system sensor histidine kinase KdpD